MIRFFTKNQYKYGVFALWAILAILQASFTELMDDEAYYWVYSRHLDWGYFDHPPMIALLIKLGYALFHSELGVRLGMVVLNVLTLILVDKLIPQKNNLVFYLILAGMGAMQLGGILAVPDIPLIFFATLYFYIYRNFLESQSWKNTLLLALSMALMFYSKYHGVLLVFFTVLSNLHLLKLYRFYIAVIVTSALFFPHLYWQYTHGFPSLQYHLVERNASAYDISFTLDYLLGQVLLFGPLVGWLLLYYAFRTPVQSSFERALKFSLVGVLAFFLLSTFKGRVEANWTVMVFAPLVILAHQGMVRQGYSMKVLQKTWWVSLLLVLVVRVYMVWDFAPGVEIRPEIHHNKTWTAALSQKAGGRPVVFVNSYQAPSKYMFYTGQPSYSLNSAFARRSQYNYWHMEEGMWGKGVLLASGYRGHFSSPDSLLRTQGTIYFDTVSPYYSYQLIQFMPAVKAYTLRPGETLQLKVGVQNGYNVPVQTNPAAAPFVEYVCWNDEGVRNVVRSDLPLATALQQDSVVIPVTAPAEKGNYHLKLTLPVPAGLEPSNNSPLIRLKIE
ncbi:glycosyltransferase family 39 protein [Chitinophaga sp.]|uniref:ArnT family glycosyltransferase n=1 Tax=Chitinophaga sp. TaxID=1869181 RepID=UPI0031DEF674